MKKILAIGVAAALAGGCTMAPEYKQPPLPTATAYPAEGQPGRGSVSAVTLGWRGFFHDARLERLIETALANNRDMRIAVARIEEARGQYRIQRADLLPTIDGTASAVRARTQSPGVAGAAGEARTMTSYQAGLGVTSFELDFWGRVRSLSNAARAGYLATVEAERAFRIGLIADVASTYLSLREADERIALAEATVQSRKEGLEIARLRLDAGVTSALDYRQSETLLTQAETELATLRRARAATRNQLDVLVGGPIEGPLPEALALEAQGMTDRLGAGLPSDLLLNRPDILEAEQQLRAANANIGAARAAFFPRITLTGSGGYESVELKDGVGQDGLSWSLGPASLTLPIFDFGRNQAIWIWQRRAGTSRYPAMRRRCRPRSARWRIRWRRGAIWRIRWRRRSARWSRSGRAPSWRSFGIATASPAISRSSTPNATCSTPNSRS